MNNFILNMVRRGAGLASTVISQPPFTPAFGTEANPARTKDGEPVMPLGDEATAAMPIPNSRLSPQAQVRRAEETAPVQLQPDYVPLTPRIPDTVSPPV